VQAWRDARGHGGSGAAGEDYDRPIDRAQERAFEWRNRAERLRTGQIGDHDGERLRVALFSSPELPDRRFGSGVAREVKTAKPLERADRSIPEGSRSPGQRIFSRERRAAGVEQAETGTATGARDHLRMKSPITWVFVLRTARPAHHELRHGRAFAIVGNVRHHSQTRPAVHAVQEGVAVTPVLWIEQLAETVFTSRHIRTDEHTFAAVIDARIDSEAGVAERRQCTDFQVIDAGERRREVPQGVHETINSVGVAFDLDEDAPARILHEAAQAEMDREAVHEWAEAHALHDARHDYGSTGLPGGRKSGRARRYGRRPRRGGFDAKSLTRQSVPRPSVPLGGISGPPPRLHGMARPYVAEAAVRADRRLVLAEPGGCWGVQTSGDPDPAANSECSG
jgi:hypothetical protein